jgi:O-antigen/teichoic acid export membrane protein
MSVRKSIMWTVLGQGILFSAQMSAQIIVARKLSPYLVGVAAIAFSISDFVNLMQTFGLRNFLIREKVLTKELICTIFTINLLASLLTSALVVTIAAWGGAVYHEPGVRRVLFVIALIPVVMSCELVPGGLLQRNMKFGPLAVASAVRAVIAAAVSIALVFRGFEYMSIGYGSLAGAVVSVATTCFLGRHYLTLQLTLRHWRIVSLFCMHMFTIGGVSNLAGKTTELIVGKLLGLESLGLFTRASSLNNVLWGNIHTVFTKVIFSAMADERRNTGSIRNVYLRTVDLVTALLWPAFAGLAIFSGPTVYFLYGDKWIGAGPILAIFSIAAIVLTATTMTWEVFVVCERTGEQSKIEMARAVLGMVATTIGSLFSVRGAALGRVADALINFTLYRRRLGDITETKNSEIFLIYYRNATLTVITIFPSLIIMYFFSWSPMTPIGWVSFGAFSGIGLWLWSSRLLNKTLAEEISRLFGRVAGLRGAR